MTNDLFTPRQYFTPLEAIEKLSELDFIKFSCNWNGKLYTNRFTTIRLTGTYKPTTLYHGVLKHPQGEVEILNKKNEIERYRSMGPVLCLNEEKTTLGALTESICYADTGYCLATTKDIIQKMYAKLFAVNGDNLKLSIYVFEHTDFYLGQVDPEIKMKEVPDYAKHKDLFKILYNLTLDQPSITLNYSK